jgi:D-lactate dehydrogenase (cytochrome)
MKAINDGGVIDAPYPVADTLLFKIQGDSESIELASRTIGKILKAYGSTQFEFAATQDAAEAMWQNRKYAAIAILACVPNSRFWATDVW